MASTSDVGLRNWHKWGLTILLAFAGGVITCASDVNAQFGDYVRHGLIGAAPAIAALNMKLQKEEPS